jgi:hypothetical protein
VAVGAPDANGIYQYTEEDLASPFSTTLNKLAGSVSATLTGATYVPTLTTDTGPNPSGYTATGRYRRSGKILLVQFSVVMGASFTPGTGVYRVSLPPGVSVYAAGGVVRAYDGSTGNAHLDCRVALGTGTALSFQFTFTHGGPLSTVGATTPWVWASGDILDGFAICEQV